MALVRWRTPKIRPEEAGGEAKVTSVDLFYDLIFAVVVAQLATGLSDNLTQHGFLVFALLFVAVVRVWSSETIYSDRFEAVDVSYRIEVFLAMLSAGGMAVAAPQGLGRLFPLFALSIASARVLFVGQWLRAARHEPLARRLAQRYLGLYGGVAALWSIAAVGPVEWRLPLAVAAVALDLASPLFVTRLQEELGRFSGEHLSDRFGAFFLLVLGQIIVVTVLVMTRLRQPSLADLVAGVLSFVIAFEMWWIYVDHVVGRPLRKGNASNAVWVYLNIPLFMATGAFGSAALTFVTRGEQVVPDPVRWVLAGSFAVVLMFSGLAELALERMPTTSASGSWLGARWSRLGVIHGLPAVLSLLVAFFGSGLSAIPLLSALLLVGILAVLLGEYPRAGL
jgi:low temperature requirement protein LtrA